ncbi:mediator of RNA polymerase II transcription subunit 26 [Diabrotica virgifera virgifera]|uniref:Mediator of RNA polymerase II transcription subunit 26 n=1 Tax=Diabrotica virgifera virgifera TaxID=50390 RepID=A0A6P7FAI7_DIAVI|nr:mediator of RNA polymerase II transcription subunit 26 [Diabrotica virgifera virgifera]
MQNNVTELTHRLLRSLDSNYNVIDMPAVIEIISLLEKVAITKELLETTRLGKYINELRKKTTNEALSKRAKELVKKWRNAVLPESNGQLKQSPPLQQPVILSSALPVSQEDVNLNQIKAKKRPAKEALDNINSKRIKLNGGISELDFSDNSNSSFKDVIATVKTEPKRDVIIINSDSNSSMPEKHDPPLDQQLPKKRGRKKGSKNHRSLLDEAESSFTSKLAVSRGNSKVKTTQELVASLQSRNSSSVLNSLVKPKEDLTEKAAKLTERVSIIDQQLNTNANRNKSSQRNKFKFEKNERVIESGSVINDKSLLIKKEEEDAVVVDAEEEEDEDEDPHEAKEESQTKVKEESQETENLNFVSALSVEDALAQLPPIDKSVLLEDDEVQCTCILKENKSDFSVEEEAEIDLEHKFEFVEDHNCQAKYKLRETYHLDHVTDEMVERLHNTLIPNVNGNSSMGPPAPEPVMQENGLYVNVVPNVNIESIPKNVKNFAGENFSRYSFSETPEVKQVPEERTGGDVYTSDNKCFREWHEVTDTTSYQGEIFKILPYVIID